MRVSYLLDVHTRGECLEGISRPCFCIWTTDFFFSTLLVWETSSGRLISVDTSCIYYQTLISFNSIIYIYIYRSLSNDRSDNITTSRDFISDSIKFLDFVKTISYPAVEPMPPAPVPTQAKVAPVEKICLQERFDAAPAGGGGVLSSLWGLVAKTVSALPKSPSIGSTISTPTTPDPVAPIWKSQSLRGLADTLT